MKIVLSLFFFIANFTAFGQSFINADKIDLFPEIKENVTLNRKKLNEVIYHSLNTIDIDSEPKQDIEGNAITYYPFCKLSLSNTVLLFVAFSYGGIETINAYLLDSKNYKVLHQKRKLVMTGNIYGAKQEASLTYHKKNGKQILSIKEVFQGKMIQKIYQINAKKIELIDYLKK